MHKSPNQIARSLRAFRNAHRLGLLRSVHILFGSDACDAAQSQGGVEYIGNVVPRLPLAGCTRGQCDCKYVASGTDQLHRLDAVQKSRARPPS